MGRHGSGCQVAGALGLIYVAGEQQQQQCYQAQQQE
jgi:hypothetical protein